MKTVNWPGRTSIDDDGMGADLEAMLSTMEETDAEEELDFEIPWAPGDDIASEE